MYIADFLNQRIRRVDPSGVIHTVAGGGPSAQGTGDGLPATQATVNGPWGVDVTSDGTIYIADANDERVRRVGPDGIIQTVAGTGNGFCESSNYGHPATTAHLCAPTAVRSANDGSFYLAESNAAVVDRVGPDGIIRLVAGTGVGGQTGDGGPATSAAIRARDLAIGPDGTLTILGNTAIRHIDSLGTISTVLGIENNASSTGDNGPPASATITSSDGIRIGPDGTLYVADKSANLVRRVQPALPGFSAGTLLQFASQDGTEVYLFDPSGRHLKTLDAFSGAVIHEFTYDPTGRLSGVFDVDRNLTRIAHEPSGHPTSITPPFAQPTTLEVDANGYLARVTDPAGQQTQFTYDPTGLMQTMIDARSGLHSFTYDSAGRLLVDQDPAGGSKTLSRTTLAAVDITTKLGIKSTYQTSTSSTGTFSRLNTLPDGTQASLQAATNGTITTTVPDGTTTTTAQTPDPRFGMFSPLQTVTTVVPSGLTSTRTTTRSLTPLSGPLSTWTETTNLSGNTSTRVFDVTARTWTTTSPLLRQTVITVDAAGRPTQISIPNITPFELVYDPSGRLLNMCQGSPCPGAPRTWTMGYDSAGFLQSVTDPLQHQTTYQNDAVGRPTSTTLPDLRIVGTGYDGDSNLTSLTPPITQNVHTFRFTPVDLVSTYTPPPLASGPSLTQYSYDVDGRLQSVNRPDGVSLVSTYDPVSGRLMKQTYPQGDLTRTYEPTTGRLATLATPGGETLAFSYDGFLQTGLTWRGLVSGAVTFGFDSSFRLVSRAVNGQAVALGYDADSLLTQAGALTVTRDPQNGRLTGTTMGSLTDTYSYRGNGLFLSYVAKFNGSTLYSESVIPDALGRITQKTETVGSETHVWGYTYYPAGRLTDVTKDASTVSHYGYDGDDNRTTFTGPGGTVNPTYDAQDRLLTHGGATYAYTANGELTSKTVAGQATSYTYDALGNLVHVGVPGGTAIDYIVDGENRRVGKKLGGTLAQGFLYQDALHVVAQLDAAGNVVARFVFGTKPNVPDYFTSTAGTFRILSDHLGSPRLVVDTSNGNVVERIDYDDFGNVTMDTSPGLTPFGFAGGLYDKDTGLVRFGARDYDASVGRWTSKDPIRFQGGINLYVYMGGDPINGIDPAGTDNFDFDGCVQGCLMSAYQSASGFLNGTGLFSRFGCGGSKTYSGASGAGVGRCPAIPPWRHVREACRGSR